MSLLAKITQDISTAMKEKITSRVAVLRLMKSALKNEQIKLGHELSEEEIIKVLQREAKQRRDSITAYEKAGRLELAEAENLELDIINSYLPSQLSDADLELIIGQVITDTGATNLADTGAVMGQVMSLIKGQADGARVSAIVRQKLT